MAESGKLWPSPLWTAALYSLSRIHILSKYPEKKVKNQWYKKVCDSVMARNELVSKVWAYEYGVIWNGMEGVWRFTGDSRYFD